MWGVKPFGMWPLIITTPKVNRIVFPLQLREPKIKEVQAEPSHSTFPRHSLGRYSTPKWAVCAHLPVLGCQLFTATLDLTCHEPELGRGGVVGWWWLNLL